MLRAVLIMLFAFAIGARAQPEHTAPIAWETYADKELGFSVDLPKLPMRTLSTDPCGGVDSVAYYVYSADVVYRVRVFRRGTQSIPLFCKPAKFNADDFFRKNFLMSHNAPVERSDAGFQSIKFSDDLFRHVALSDPKGNRVFEFSYAARPSAEVNESRWVGSFLPATKPGSLEIAKGALQILGDVEPVPGSPRIDTSTTPFKIIYRPRADYTAEAREAKISGTVIVRIELLASGTVGKIEAIKELPKGLTREAIKAARQVVFLPEKLNGTNVPKSVTLEYGFKVH